MNKDGLFAFYGTLRQGVENHLVYQHGMKLLQTVTLAGYKLYSLGEYPYAVFSGHSHHTIITEVYHVHDSQVALAIHNMEIEAGYYYQEIEVGLQHVGIYLFDVAGLHDDEIPSGDWVRHVSQIDF